MDICLIKTDKGTHILPSSVHGMLWLQTHFENENWEAISNKQVRVTNNSAKELEQDAKSAGINLNWIPVQMISSNLSKL